MKNRREFLNSCAVGAAALVAPTSLMAAEATTANTRRKLSKAGFTALINEGFRCVSGHGSAIPLTLVEVRDGPQSPGLDQFGLLLKSSAPLASAQLPAALYRLYHPATGAMLVHLAPSDSVSGGYATQFAVMA